MSDLNQNNNKIDNKKFKYLSFDERINIQELLGYSLQKSTGIYVRNNNKIYGIREIGRLLNRSHSTISDELKKYKEAYTHERFYKAIKANKLFLLKCKNKGNKFKLIDNNNNYEENLEKGENGYNFKYQKLKDFVLNNLKEGLSPEQISGRIRELKLSSELGGSISYETIYNFIYNSSEGKKDKLYKYLRRHRKKPIKYGSRRGRSKGGSIKDLVKISERNKDIKIKNRLEIGHWETDSMIFSNQKDILSVQVERKSRFVHITKLENKTAEKTLLALDDLYKYANDDISKNGLNIVKTMTFDRGLEGAYHYELNKKYGIKTYFCNPYSSRQKGGVENMNMFIREYFPRNIKMKDVTDDYIKEIQDKLNNRPRKCLNYLTPKEFLEIEINKIG